MRGTFKSAGKGPRSGWDNRLQSRTADPVRGKYLPNAMQAAHVLQKCCALLLALRQREREFFAGLCLQICSLLAFGAVLFRLCLSNAIAQRISRERNRATSSALPRRLLAR